MTSLYFTENDLNEWMTEWLSNNGLRFLSLVWVNTIDYHTRKPSKTLVLKEIVCSNKENTKVIIRSEDALTHSKDYIRTSFAQYIKKTQHIPIPIKIIGLHKDSIATDKEIRLTFENLHYH